VQLLRVYRSTQGQQSKGIYPSSSSWLSLTRLFLTPLEREPLLGIQVGSPTLSKNE